MKQNSVVISSRDSGSVPRTRARARFLAQAIQLEEQPPSKIIRISIYITTLTLAAAIAWATITHVDEIALANGKVVPAGLIHDVQHLEGGIFSEIVVRNEDRVEQADLFLRFAPSASQSEYDQALVRKMSLEMEVGRLQAVIEEREPDFSISGNRYAELAFKQKMIYKAQMASHESELNVQDAQIRQRHTEMIRQQNQAHAIEEELKLLQEQVEIRTQLAARQMVARTELLSAQLRMAEVQGEKRKIQDSIFVAKTAWQEGQQRRQQIIAGFRKETELALGDVAAKLAEVEQTLIRLKDRVARLDVHAPVSGIIQGLSITRINTVVEPGQVIMQIVLVEDDLIVEAHISPDDIGHIYTGQTADVKVDSYDVARFGSVKGIIRQISPSTISSFRNAARRDGSTAKNVKLFLREPLPSLCIARLHRVGVAEVSRAVFYHQCLDDLPKLVAYYEAFPTALGC